MVVLTAKPITAISFERYGWLLEAGDALGTSINGGSSQRIHSETALELNAQGGRACMALFKATARDPAGPWSELERHSLGTQTFIPLGGVRYVVLVALNDPAQERPDVGTLEAFYVNGQQSITLKAGVWHHGLLALNAGNFVVLERSAAHVDCDVVQLTEPVQIVLP
jgi:ureidoglycolate lyase